VDDLQAVLRFGGRSNPQPGSSPDHRLYCAYHSLIGVASRAVRLDFCSYQ
jgi:hypothetical protein